MSKPKNMTPEQEAAWKEKISERNKAYRKANREKIHSKEKTYREANREKVAAMRKAWRDDNPEKEAARRKAKSKNLTPAYVAKILRLKTSEVPPDLLELKREQIRLIRLTRELKKESQNV